MMISALKMIADKDGALRRLQAHDVEHAELRIERHEHRRDDREVFRDVVGDREGGQRAAGDQQLLADRDDLDQLGRVAVEIDHVAGFARRHRPGVHRDADIRLRQRRRVVGAVAAHRDELALGLLLADQLELVLGRRLGEEIVDPGFGGDRRRGQRVVAGDHDRADAHLPQLGEALADAALDDVLEVDDAEQPVVLGDGERRAALSGDPLGDDGHLAHRVGDRRRAQRRLRAAGSAAPKRAGAAAFGERNDRVDRPLADRDAADIDAAHPRLRRERNESGIERRHLAPAQPVFLLGQHHDRAAFRGLVGERGELRRVGELGLVDAGECEELGRLAVAERDRAGLVEQQGVDVARGLDRAARHREHVEAHEPVHAGDADRRQQRADRRRDQADEERDEDDDRYGTRRRKTQSSGS